MKPIKLEFMKAEIKLTGNKKKNWPYLTITVDGIPQHGCVADKDIKRLKKWCDDCLEGSENNETQ